MQHLPNLVIEGMIIAGLVTGAQRGIFYIRHEYEAQEKILEEEIHRCRREGLLGPNILGSSLSFELEMFVSPGGYICGEETALMEAIEGKRAEPRNKPPFPVTHGLWNKPTALNNVETFANVPQILVNGVDWYKAQGQGGAAGLKFVGVSGDVRRPGIFIIPMGLPVSEVIFNHAGGIRDGKQLKAFAPSGPSSGYLPASMADVRLDFKSLASIGSMLGSGAIVVCAEGTCMLDMALNAVNFFPQRILREMRAVPDGIAENGGYSHGVDPRQGLTRRFEISGRALRGAETDLDLRVGPVRAFADHIRAQTFS